MEDIPFICNLCNNQNLYISQLTPTRKQPSTSEHLTVPEQDILISEYSKQDKSKREDFSNKQQMSQNVSEVNHVVTEEQVILNDSILIPQVMQQEQQSTLDAEMEDGEEVINLITDKNTSKPPIKARSDLVKSTSSRNNNSNLNVIHQPIEIVKLNENDGTSSKPGYDRGTKNNNNNTDGDNNKSNNSKSKPKKKAEADQRQYTLNLEKTIQEQQKTIDVLQKNLDTIM